MEDVNKPNNLFFVFLNLRAVPKKSTTGEFTYLWHFQKTVINATKFEKTSIDVFAAVAVVDATAPYLLDASAVAILRFVNGCCHFQPPICKEREAGGGGGGFAYSRATHCPFNTVLRVVSYSIKTKVIKILITVITLLPGQSPFTQISSHHEQPCIADVHLLQLCVSSPHLSSPESQQNPLKKEKTTKKTNQ